MDPVEPPPPYGAPPQPGAGAGTGPTPPHGPPPPAPTDELGLFAAWRVAAKSTARASAKASNATRRTVRRATNAQGAGESGMAKLTELAGLNSAGDVMVTVALAGTLFFSVPTGEARDRVGLYLLVTMVPFALLAPVIGPLLDKFRSGRRGALAVTFLVRAVLVWTMAGGIEDAQLWLYPAVFGVLVSSRAFGLIKAAGVPRLVPPNIPLVRANSWTNMAGIAAAACAAAVGAPVTHVLGPQWTLRMAAVLFLFGIYLSLKLPKSIDTAKDERPAAMGDHTITGGKGRYVGPSVEMGLRANVVFRGLSGFLTLFLAFLIREHPIGTMDPNIQLSLVIGAAGVGSVAGTAIGGLLKTRGPEIVIVTLLAADIVAIWATAFLYGLTVLLIAGFVVGFAQVLGKLSLDSMIQRDVEESVRSSAFARSETRLQLSWVIGGAFGVFLPLRGGLAFGLAGLAMVGLTVEMLRHGRETRQGSKSAKPGTQDGTHPGTDPDSHPGPPPTPRSGDFPPTRNSRLDERH